MDTIQSCQEDWQNPEVQQSWNSVFVLACSSFIFHPSWLPICLFYSRMQASSTKYLEWSNVESIIAVVFSCVGILITLFVTLIFIQYRDTPVVKSSSRELCYIILAGIFLGYICPFTLIAHPTVTSCYLQRLLVGLSSAMCYSALVTKTNRIARILAGSKKNNLHTQAPLHERLGTGGNRLLPY